MTTYSQRTAYQSMIARLEEWQQLSLTDALQASEQEATEKSTSNRSGGKK